MPKNPGNQGSRKKAGPPNAVPPPQSDPQPDYGQFRDIIGIVLAVLVPVLQANGVDLDWQISAFVYVGAMALVGWTFLSHAMPHGKRKTRYIRAGLLMAILGGLGAYATVKEFHKENPVASDAPLVEKDLYGPDRERFVATLKAFRGERDSLEFACPPYDEGLCAKAGRYLVAFSEAGWPLRSDGVNRVALAIPPEGVAIITRSQAPKGITLPPHMGWWTKLDDSDAAIRGALGSMGISTSGSADENLPANALILYFGPPPSPSALKH